MTTPSPSFGPRGGSALLMAVLVAVLLGGMTVALLQIGVRFNREQVSSVDDERALFLAEAGLEEALLALRQGATGALGDEHTPVAFGGGVFWVQVDELAESLLCLRSAAMCGAGRVALERLVFHEPADPVVSHAAFGDTSLHLDSNALVDSYDSDLGSYASQVGGNGSTAHALENGDVGSNQDVDADSNVRVFGNVTPGPDHSATITGNAQVTGSTAAALVPKTLPPIDVPDIPTSGPYTASNTTLVSGQYHFTTLEANSNETLTVIGPATIVAEDFELNSNAQFIVDATAGPVELYVMNDFILDSNALMYATSYKAQDLSIKLLTDNIQDPEAVIQLDDALFDSDTKVWGTIYAPNAAMEIDSNFELFGALVASSVDLNSNSSVHFDEALLRTAGAAHVYTSSTLSLAEFPVREFRSDRSDPFGLLGVEPADLPSPAQAHVHP